MGRLVPPQNTCPPTPAHLSHTFSLQYLGLMLLKCHTTVSSPKTLDAEVTSSGPHHLPSWPTHSLVPLKMLFHPHQCPLAHQTVCHVSVLPASLTCLSHLDSLETSLREAAPYRFLHPSSSHPPGMERPHHVIPGCQTWWDRVREPGWLPPLQT